jgi:transcriptional regulator with GAF, ATPase, and Fis domain
MNSNLSKQQLFARIKDLENESIKRKRYEKINQTLFRISNSINTTSNLSELYESIHRSLSSIIDTTNFFIARFDNENDSVEFPYCVDEIDGQLPPVKNFTKTASLTAEVVRTGKPILIDKKATIAFRKDSGWPIPSCTPSEQWLGAPLKFKGRIIGVIAIQTYTNKRLYDETDKEVIVSVADQVALAIERKTSEEKRETLIKELHTALEEVKILQGILPICSYCKKIRDDKGYWNQIEDYIRKHSDAEFSHSICKKCAEKHYPDLNFYDD